MWRIRKLCIYLNDFINNRSLEKYRSEFHEVLRKGVKINEQNLFIDYVIQKDGKNSSKISDEISDLLKQEFFETKTYQGAGFGFEFIRLGWKGREIVEGGFIKK